MKTIKEEIVDLMVKCVEFRVDVIFEKSFDSQVRSSHSDYVTIPFGTQLFEIYEILKSKVEHIENIVAYQENSGFFESEYTKIKERKQ